MNNLCIDNIYTSRSISRASLVPLTFLTVKTIRAKVETQPKNVAMFLRVSRTTQHRRNYHTKHEPQKQVNWALKKEANLEVMEVGQE